MCPVKGIERDGRECHPKNHSKGTAIHSFILHHRHMVWQEQLRLVGDREYTYCYFIKHASSLDKEGIFALQPATQLHGHPHHDLEL